MILQFDFRSLLTLLAINVAFSGSIASPIAAQEQRTYAKHEVRIPMRDGVTLHTTIYSPVDSSEKWPMLLQRTPYGCWPYGEELPETIMYNSGLVESGYIFVYQDLRSRSMSDGDPEFENLKPAYSLNEPDRIDEVTDARDTIDWLLANVPNHNQAVGIFGSSYMGYTALMGAVTGHPNLKAVLSAAPSIDIYFEDFNRNGLFTLAYTPILDWFGTPKTERHPGPWWENNLSYWADNKRFGLAFDSYDFFLDQGALSNYGNVIPEKNYFWKLICEHPDYDAYRQERNSLQYLRGIKCPVLIVGGWNDEQNLYGTINAYKTINSENPDCDCRVMMGPWVHSGHKKPTNQLFVGDIFYGNQQIEDYQRFFEFPFFESHLKNRAADELPEARLYDTGTKTWINLEEYAIGKAQPHELFLNAAQQLTGTSPVDDSLEFQYISNPQKPVPYILDNEFQLFPASSFMTSDQRFASRRNDVLTFVTPPLEDDLMVFGEVTANLKFSTDQTDADLIVKLIDVLPMDREPQETDPKGVKMNGYQQLVRCGQIRGRYRESYSDPKPFVHGEITDVDVQLLDVCHTFGKGHRIMIQVQSSLFPLFDRNPQKYVENIYKATDEDFQKAIHRIHAGSSIKLNLHPER